MGILRGPLRSGCVAGATMGRRLLGQQIDFRLCAAVCTVGIVGASMDFELVQRLWILDIVERMLT